MLAELHVNNQKRNQRSNLVYLGGSNFVKFGPFWVKFGSIWSVLVQFGSNRSYLVLFGPHNGLADLVQLCLLSMMIQIAMFAKCEPPIGPQWFILGHSGSYRATMVLNWLQWSFEAFYLNVASMTDGLKLT